MASDMTESQPDGPVADSCDGYVDVGRMYYVDDIYGMTFALDLETSEGEWRLSGDVTGTGASLYEVALARRLHETECDYQRQIAALVKERDEYRERYGREAMEHDKLCVTGRDGTVYEWDHDTAQPDIPWRCRWMGPDGKRRTAFAEHFDNALCDALLAARREWVPCSDRTPELQQSVAFIVKSRDDLYDGRALGGVFQGEIVDHEGKHWQFSTPGVMWFGTHWMPLPSPPKETT